MDLQAYPELIDKVPEVQGWPELIALLEAINAPSCPFRSLGCEKSYSNYRNPAYPHLAIQLCSYVDVAFLDIALNQNASLFEEMIGAYALFATSQHFEKFVMFDPELSHATYREHNLKGWCLSIWVGGFGATQAEARTAWAAVISALTAFFRSGWAPHPSIGPTA
jgi:hypothetical protein